MKLKTFVDKATRKATRKATQIHREKARVASHATSLINVDVKLWSIPAEVRQQILEGESQGESQDEPPMPLPVLVKQSFLERLTDAIIVIIHELRDKVGTKRGER